jgi:putative FmdB family regulatory protein
MPIYEYSCAACGHNLEAFQKMSDAPLTECPECHKSELTKLISAAGFQLKGTGWYATDFKNKGKPVAQSSSTSSDGGATDIKTETKSSGTKSTD